MSTAFKAAVLSLSSILSACSGKRGTTCLHNYNLRCNTIVNLNRFRK
nr:MAG TPA: protein of unknown function (DUF4169) [Caudoviricetes sp.]